MWISDNIQIFLVQDFKKISLLHINQIQLENPIWSLPIHESALHGTRKTETKWCAQHLSEVTYVMVSMKYQWAVVILCSWMECWARWRGKLTCPLPMLIYKSQLTHDKIITRLLKINGENWLRIHMVEQKPRTGRTNQEIRLSRVVLLYIRLVMCW